MRPLLFYALAGMIVLCDQVSKWAVVRTYPLGASQETPIPYLYLTHTRNTGGAFSLLQAQNHWFIIIAAVAMVALALAYHRSARRDLYVSAALSLALGGAIGNLIDRVRFGWVIDFFDVKVWPVFNVADSAITFGILILAYSFLFSRETSKEGVQASGPSGVQEVTTGTTGDTGRTTEDMPTITPRDSMAEDEDEIEDNSVPERLNARTPERPESASPTPNT